MTVHNVHDSGYKKVFTNRTFFRQLLETFVNEPWVADLDFSEAETLDKSFIADHYKATEGDLIYKVKLRGEADRGISPSLCYRSGQARRFLAGELVSSVDGSRSDCRSGLRRVGTGVSFDSGGASHVD